MLSLGFSTWVEVLEPPIMRVVAQEIGAAAYKAVLLK
jgi:hypothetical protein